MILHLINPKGSNNIMAVSTDKNATKVTSVDSSKIGSRISREFDSKIYHGTVDGHNPRRRLWHVTYDDGDAEELDRYELLSAIELFKGSTDVSYVGRRVSRKFGRKIYNGIVDKFDGTDRLWHITYGDGDAEELDHEELLFALDLFDKDAQEGKAACAVPKEKAAITADDDETSSAKKRSMDSKQSTNPATANNHHMSFTIPVIVAIIASIIWLCRQVLVANAAASSSNQEELLRSTPFLKFQPDKFQGAHKRKKYFEGWYYKFVVNNDDHDVVNDNADGSSTNKIQSMAVVPGIFYGNATDSNESHAFVFVTLNGERQHYYRFETSEFTFASPTEEYYIQVGENRFTHEGVDIKLRPHDGDDAELVLRGKLAFSNPTPWPVSLMELGAMGPVGWLPGLECTHGILSFDHVLSGSLDMSFVGDDKEKAPSSISFDNGRGYTEKDFGRSFPSLWVWIQSNSFAKNPGTSLFVSIAQIPLFGMKLPGFTTAIWHNGTLIPFATWSGAKFEDMRISKEEVYVAMRSGGRRRSDFGYRMEITVDRRNVPEVLLYAPVNFTQMAPFVLEALQATVHVRLFDRHGSVLLDDVGKYAGLEVHGNAQWLVDNVCGKKSANRVFCL